MGRKTSLFEEFWLAPEAREREGLPLGTARALANAGFSQSGWGATMKGNIYLQLAEVCERTAASACLPESKAGMLASAAVWRRLAMAFMPSKETGSNTRRDKVAVLGGLETRSVSAVPNQPFSDSKS
jgi:hypothetical protein